MKEPMPIPFAKACWISFLSHPRPLLLCAGLTEPRLCLCCQVRQLQSKLRTLSMQIACGEKPPDALVAAGEDSKGLLECCKSWTCWE